MDARAVREIYDESELVALRARIEKEYRDQGEQRPVFVHLNLDGSVAVAVGEEPDVWPEYEPKPPDALDDQG